jgi:hypothetical protein
VTRDTTNVTIGAASENRMILRVEVLSELRTLSHARASKWTKWGHITQSSAAFRKYSKPITLQHRIVDSGRAVKMSRRKPLPSPQFGFVT